LKREVFMLTIKRRNYYLPYSVEKKGIERGLWSLILKKTRNFSKAVFLAFAQQRHKEAARIISIYGSDRWSDNVERQVGEIDFIGTIPPRD
jgi:hypothetical protein